MMRAKRKNKTIARNRRIKALMLRAAKHLRNTDELEPIKWSWEAAQILIAIRAFDPRSYDRIVKRGMPEHVLAPGHDTVKLPMLFDPKRNGVAIVLYSREENTVLQCRRLKCRDMNGFWQFPGGSIEGGESAIAAAARELAEETGIRVAGRFLQPLCIGSGMTNDKCQLFVTQFFLLDVDKLPGLNTTTPVNMEPHKHSDWQWVEVNAARKLPQISLIPLVFDELEKWRRS